MGGSSGKEPGCVRILAAIVVCAMRIGGPLA